MRASERLQELKEKLALYLDDYLGDPTSESEKWLLTATYYFLGSLSGTRPEFPAGMWFDGFRSVSIDCAGSTGVVIKGGIVAVFSTGAEAYGSFVLDSPDRFNRRVDWGALSGP